MNKTVAVRYDIYDSCEVISAMRIIQEVAHILAHSYVTLTWWQQETSVVKYEVNMYKQHSLQQRRFNLFVARNFLFWGRGTS